VRAEVEWPNLFLVGAPRAGSTALYEFLGQHPEIFMSPSKEPGFLAVDGELFDLEHRRGSEASYFITSIDAYRRLFRHRDGEPLFGEATPHYLHDPRVPLRIRHYSPAAKVVAILRSPAARAHSAHMMEVRDGAEPCTFTDAVKAALADGGGAPMLAAGFYADAIARYQEAMGRELTVVLHDDLVAQPAATLGRLYEARGVDPEFVPDTRSRPNRSGLPRSRRMHRLVSTALDHRVMRRVHLHGPRGSGKALERLRNRYYASFVEPRALPGGEERFYNRALYREDILRTSELIERDLSSWLDG
jgi:hypothetical protein